MLLNKNEIILVKGIKVMLTEDTLIDKGDKGKFIINFWESFDYKDLSVLPVVFVKCESVQAEYILLKENIEIGNEGDICLI